MLGNWPRRALPVELLTGSGRLPTQQMSSLPNRPKTQRTAQFIDIGEIMQQAAA
ncbi:MAG: hypothetical protein K2X77_22745 [Candidatus Obscuribacterales bacterium]|nr:hypothetical protein [Candidatus Obscuribacterales bacterium]